MFQVMLTDAFFKMKVTGTYGICPSNLEQSRDKLELKKDLGLCVHFVLLVGPVLHNSYTHCHEWIYCSFLFKIIFISYFCCNLHTRRPVDYDAFYFICFK